MASYHVNGCDCPSGCCSCGPSRDTDLAVMYDFKLNEIYLYDSSNTSFNMERHAELVGDVFLGMLIEKEG